MALPKNSSEAIDEIVKHPDDDKLRLQFAKLERKYDADRAKFVELQVKRAVKQRRERDQAFDLPSDEQALLNKHRLEWTHTLRKYTLDVEFYRGFIARVVIEPYVFLEYGEFLLVNEPIQHVDFAPAQDGAFPLADLLASPLLARMDSISFTELGLNDDDVAKLAASPNLERLTWLGLNGNPLGPRAFEALAAAPATRALLYVSRDTSFSHHRFPGERYVQTDRQTRWDDYEWEWTGLPEEGQALERRYGYIPWLHPSVHACSRFDARWYVENGVLPVKRPGSKVSS